MSWDYAELSKKAKESGGPEALIDRTYEEGKKAGRNEALSVLGFGAAAALLLIACIKKLINYRKERNTKSEKVIDEIKEEFVQEIEQYETTCADTEHDLPDESDTQSHQ